MTNRFDALTDVVGGAEAVVFDAVISPPLLGFTVATSGDVAVVYADGTEAVLPGRLAGIDYGGLITMVKSAGTTMAANEIIGFH